MALSFRPSWWPSSLYAVGMTLVFLGQRVLELGRPGNITTGLGAALVLASLATRARRVSVQPEAFKPAERTLLKFGLLGLLALLLYFANSDIPYFLTGKTLEQRSPRLSTVFSALWPTLWITASLPMAFAEMALSGMARAPVLDAGRLRSARMAGLGISFATVFTFAISYVAAERNIKADLSFFRTAKPGDSTKKIVQALDKEIQIHIFFPPANEVREEVQSYFSELARESKFLVVSYWDHALHPAKARELDVSGNGVVVVAREALKEKIPVPLVLETARAQLRTLDSDVNRRLLGVSRKQKIAYFTTGHDERTEAPMDESDKRGTMKGLRQILTDQGFEPKELGLSSGLGTEVPADAGLVLIMGPRKPFQPEEMAALVRYMDKLGRALIALDPDGKQTLPELLGPLALKYNPIKLANDRNYLQRTYQKSDRELLVTAAYSSHVSVSTLSKWRDRMPLILLGSGYLEKDEKSAMGIVNVDFTVHGDPATFPDKNEDFENNEGENRNAYELAAAVNKRNASALLPEEEARAVVIADADAVSDQLLGNRGNAFLAVDALRWLGGEERISGVVNNEEDVALTHTRKQDMLWFYGSIFGVPAVVMGVGLMMSRKRRQSRKAESAAQNSKPAPEVKS